MLRARLHGRGGQGTKTCGSMISLAASLEGFHSQDSPMYGPERRGAPVSSFVRVSTEQVSERGYIASPDVVVLFDQSLLDSQLADPLRGLKGSGALILNGSGSGGEFSTVSIDASSLASRFLGRNSISAAMAAVACKALGISSLDNTIEAVRTELAEIGLQAQDIESNVALARHCYGITKKLDLRTDDLHDGGDAPLVEVRYDPPSLSTAYMLTTGNSAVKKTGSWRTSRPVIDYGRCTNCSVCFVYCPDSAISLGQDLAPRIDYDNCKGCMICMTECPVHAISEETAP